MRDITDQNSTLTAGFRARVGAVLFDSTLEGRNHRKKTSHALLVGAILHVLYAEPDKTLAGVAAFLSDPRRPIEATLAAMMSTPHLVEAGVHPVRCVCRTQAVQQVQE
jgi:type IV secretory pathway TraG/TraD family ATPase VirD4